MTDMPLNKGTETDYFIQLCFGVLINFFWKMIEKVVCMPVLKTLKRLCCELSRIPMHRYNKCLVPSAFFFTGCWLSLLRLPNILTASLQDGKTPPTNVLNDTKSDIRLQWCWSFGECRLPFHCLCSHVYSSPDW